MMENRYALVDGDGLVVNLVHWDGVTPWSPGEGLVVLSAPLGVGIGWRRQDETWLEPLAEEEG